MKRKRTQRPKTGKTKGLAAHRAAPPDPLDIMVAASGQALGLTIDPSWRAGVKFNLELVLRHAARIDEFPLADEAEPAPVFRA